MGLFKRKEKRGITDITEQVASASLPIPKHVYGNGMGVKLAAVHRCVEVISNSVAQLPLEPYLITENDRVKYTAHATYNLLNKFPNRLMTRFIFIKMIISSMLLRGNAYVYIKRSRNGNIEELVYIPHELVTIQSPTSMVDLFSDVTYSVVGFNRLLENDEMLHFINFTDDGINGMSTLKRAAMTINIALQSEKSAEGFFEGGGNVSGILTVEGTISPKQRQDIHNAWNTTFKNGNSNGIAVLEKNMKFQPITINPADAQLLQSREFNVIEICRFFGVSPVIAFDYTKSNYSTVEATQLGFLTETLSPILEKLELEFERKLYSPSEQSKIDVRFDVRKLMRADIKSQAEYLSKMIQHGVLSINDARNELDMSNIGEHGNEHLIQVNMSTLKNIQNQSQNNGIGNKTE